jgi:hypothetical protein
VRHLLGTDPGGAWVTADGDGLSGAGLALIREGVWGLSLLVVRPGVQSNGLGTALLRRTLDYGADARGGIILASPDPRALRVYARAGFALHPTLEARGPARDVDPDPAVRPFRPADQALADAVSRAVRGAAHGPDLAAAAASGAELLTFPERGFVAARDGELKMLAALDEEAAAALLRTVLARASGAAEVAWMTATQQWAIDVVVAAGLELKPGGAVCLRGDVGPFRSYLPGGAYL